MEFVQIEVGQRLVDRTFHFRAIARSDIEMK